MHDLLICCTSESGEFQGVNFPTEGIGTDEKSIFKNFCRKLLCIKKLIVEEGLSVCSNCLMFISSVMETKGKLDEVEGRVRQLQLQILEELKEVKIYAEIMGLRLKKIENCVKESDESGLVAFMAERRDKFVRKGNHKDDVLDFRRSILRGICLLLSVVQLCLLLHINYV